MRNLNRTVIERMIALQFAFRPLIRNESANHDKTLLYVRYLVNVLVLSSKEQPWKLKQPVTLADTGNKLLDSLPMRITNVFCLVALGGFRITTLQSVNGSLVRIPNRIIAY